jgi:acetyl-CoA acyltransferase 1
MSLPTRTVLSSIPRLSRAASTRARPRGLPAILEKNPDDVVITFAKRTAIGRAKKGHWKDTTVDELLCALFKVRRITVLGC